MKKQAEIYIGILSLKHWGGGHNLSGITKFASGSLNSLQHENFSKFKCKRTFLYLQHLVQGKFMLALMYNAESSNNQTVD